MYDTNTPDKLKQLNNIQITLQLSLINIIEHNNQWTTHQPQKLNKKHPHLIHFTSVLIAQLLVKCNLQLSVNLQYLIKQIYQIIISLTSVCTLTEWCRNEQN